MNEISQTILARLLGIYKYWRTRELVRPYLRELKQGRPILVPKEETIVDGIAQQFWKIEIGYQPYTIDKIINDLPEEMIMDLANWEEFKIWSYSRIKWREVGNA